MIFQALLVLRDDSVTDLLRHVLADFQVETEHCPDASAAAQKLQDKHFDALVVDLDDETTVNTGLMQKLRQSSVSKNAVVVSLLHDTSAVRRAFGMGANFVLYKPLASEPARASLRAAVALLKRERRRTFRVPVQLPVTLSWQDVPEVEGIMLDLSEDGMDVLSAQPLQRTQAVNIHFSLPDLSQVTAMGEVAWANTNGQAGVEFVGFPDGQKRMVQDWLIANAPEAPPPDPEPLSNCKLSDLSLGACYVETESPFPIHTEVALNLRAAESELQLKGLVRVMHPSHGMGVEFTSPAGEHRQQVEQFIGVLSQHPGSAPQLSISPTSIHFQGVQTSSPREQAADDSLLDLIRSDTPFSEAEFQEELRKQRGSAAEAASV
jgi:DNA-binding response OmpR family regulator/Tfp pilus assembly protein PilZ